MLPMQIAILIVSLAASAISTLAMFILVGLRNDHAAMKKQVDEMDVAVLAALHERTTKIYEHLDKHYMRKDTTEAKLETANVNQTHIIEQLKRIEAEGNTRWEETRKRFHDLLNTLQGMRST